MQGRNVVVLANLKAAKMRGVKSEAMLLAAEALKGIATEEERQQFDVELVAPPPDSQVGDVLQFAPLTSEPPSKILKKLMWQQIQPHLKTNARGEVVYVEDDGAERVLKVRDAGEGAFVENLFNATVR